MLQSLSVPSALTAATTEHVPPSAISLHQWKVKRLRRDDPGVIVEGVRKRNGKRQVWHSSVIKTAESPTLLQTGTGSYYRLVGPCDILASIAAGIPSHIARYFKHGFPSQWQSLIQSCTLPSSKKPKQLTNPKSKHRTPRMKENIRTQTQKKGKKRPKTVAKTSRKNTAKKGHVRGRSKQTAVEKIKQEQNVTYYSDPETFATSIQGISETRSILEQLDALASFAKEKQVEKPTKTSKRKSVDKSLQPKKKRNSSKKDPGSSGKKKKPRGRKAAMKNERTTCVDENSGNSMSKSRNSQSACGAKQNKAGAGNHKKQSKGANKVKSRKMKEVEENGWDEEEQENLRAAYACVNPLKSRFWEEVSGLMPGRSAEECYHQWFEANATKETQTKRAARGKKDTAGGKPKKQKLAGRNTAKFRQQIRERLREEAENHRDDVCDTTPFKSGGDLNELDFDFDTDVRTPEHPDVVHQEVPLRKQTILDSERKALDAYILNELKKRRKRGKIKEPTRNVSKVSRSKSNKVNAKGATGVITPGGSVKLQVLEHTFADYSESDCDDSGSDTE